MIRLLGDTGRAAGLLALRWRGPGALEALRARKLRRLVRHAYDRVPYYRALMDGAGFRPDEIRSPDDLRRFPVSARGDLLRAGDAAVSEGAGPLETLRTSGSSGRPFPVRLTRGEQRARRLREFRALTRAGVRPLDRLVILGPDRPPRPPRLHQRLGLYRFELVRGSLPVEEQARRLQAADPTVLWAYPTMLRSVLQRHGNRLTELARPRLLISSSEVFDPTLRRQIVEDWPGEIISFYGAMEVGRIGSECRAHTGLHVDADALVVEILDGDAPAAPGTPGRVVVTALDQLAAPFIRYELGDLCAAIPAPCPCGWPTPLLDLPLGRCADLVTTRDGRQLSAARLDFVLRAETDVNQYRFIQDTPDRITAHLVFGRPPTPAHLEALARKFAAAIADTPVDVRAVDAIPHEGGKYRTFVSRIVAPDGAPRSPRG